MSKVNFVKAQISALKTGETCAVHSGGMTDEQFRMNVAYIGNKDGKIFSVNSNPLRVTRLDQRPDPSLTYRQFIAKQLDGLTEPGDARIVDSGDKSDASFRAVIQSFPVQYGVNKTPDGYRVFVKRGDKFDEDLKQRITSLERGYSLNVTGVDDVRSLVKFLNNTTDMKFQYKTHDEELRLPDGRVREAGTYVTRIDNLDIGAAIRATGVWG